MRILYSKMGRSSFTAYLKEKRMSAWVLCSSSDLILGDELDEVRVKSGLLLNLVCYIVHAGTAGSQRVDLF